MCPWKFNIREAQPSLEGFSYSLRTVKAEDPILKKLLCVPVPTIAIKSLRATLMIIWACSTGIA
jgi:hypothetical protein